MTINKNLYSDVQDGQTNGSQAAALVNDNKRAVNDVVDYINTFDAERGTAAVQDMATDSEVVDGAAGKVPDAEQVRKNHVAQVATISDLRVLEPLFDGQQIELLGHTVAGIGGGVFYADFSSSEADDNGVTIVTTGGRRWVRRLDGFVTPRMFGAAGDGVTDDTAAIQSALDQFAVIEIDTDSIIDQITPDSETRIIISGALTSSNEAPILISAKNNITVDFIGRGKLTGDGVTTTQTGITIVGGDNNTINHARIIDCLNKGVSLEGGATNCLIHKPYVRGATGSTGAGVSISGDGTNWNTVERPDCSENRIGVTINGADHNEVNHPVANACTSSGVSIDGIVSSSGDGGRYNKINHPICNNGTDASKGGVFCGNGSSYNEIIHPICNGNAGAGIRFSGGTGFENKSNKIIDPICNGNSTNGITLSFCPQMSVINPTCEGNTGRGISDTDCDGLQVRGGFVDGNSTDGILHQSPRTLDYGVTVTNNGADGIEIAFGGTLGVGDNRTESCRTTGNTGDDYKPVGTAKARNLTGFVTDNKGSDTKSDGQTIAHGLSDVPATILVTGTVASEMVAVTARDATTFTVAIKTDAGAAGTNQQIDWEASLY